MATIALSNIGSAQSALGNLAKAEATFLDAIKTYRELGDKEAEATDLSNLAGVLASAGKYPEAIKSYREALALAQTTDNPRTQAVLLDNMGGAFAHLGRAEEALDHYGRAQKLFRQIGSPTDEAISIILAGRCLADLGMEERARQNFEEAHKLALGTGAEAILSTALNELGNSELRIGKSWSKAREYFEKALDISQKRGLKQLEAVILDNLALTYDKENNLQKALGIRMQARDLLQQIGAIGDMAITLCNIGTTQSELGDHLQGISTLTEGIALLRLSGQRFHEARFLSSLSTVYFLAKMPEVAIVLGKESINTWQSIRASNQGLSAEMKSSFKGTFEGNYRELAGMLMDTGRLPEAEQVLGLLKDDEYYRFLKRGNGSSSTVDLSPREAEWMQKYHSVAENIASVAKQLQDERAKENPDQSRIDSLQADLGKASEAFQTFLKAARDQFAQAAAKTNRIDDIESAQALGRTLGKLPGSPAAIYTLVTQDGVRTVLRLPNLSKLASSSQKATAADLTKLVIDFRAALADPRIDPRPAGAKLYDLIVRPLEADLKAADVKTLLWSLDGVLRYVPLWALYDSQEHRFLVEKYPSSVFTPRTVDQLLEPGQEKWSGVAMAVSKAHEVLNSRFSPLPSPSPKHPPLRRYSAERSSLMSSSPKSRWKSLLPAEIAASYTSSLISNSALPETNLRSFCWVMERR